MAEKIRYTRKDLKEPDEFISTFGQVVAWGKENRPKVVAGILVAAGILALLFGARAYFQWRDRQAAVEIWPYLDQAHAMLVMPGSADPGNLAAMEQMLSSLTAKHKGTHTALFAKYFLGGIAFRRGDYEASATKYREVAGEVSKKDNLLAFLLNTGAGSSLEAKGDYAGAAEWYRKAEKVDGPSMKAMVQFDEARALELAGKKSEAVALYQQILNENSDSIQKDFIEILIARLE